MTTMASSNPTLLDHVRRLEPGGAVDQVVEQLMQRNPILMDMAWQQGNLPTGHRVTIRSGLPSVGWRMYNRGITPGKSTTIQVDESCGMLEGLSKVDCDLANLNGNSAAFRASEDNSFVQSLNNDLATALFYSSTKANPERIMGLAPRFDDLSADNADNIIECESGASGSDQASMYLVVWGPDTCYGIFPKGSIAGLRSEDLGKQLTADRDGAEYLAWVSHWKWDCGLCVKDWRYVIRICNIDQSAISATGTTLIDALVQAYNQVQDLEAGRAVIYANRAVLTTLDRQCMNKSNIWFTPTEWHGKKITGFRGIPIVRCDALNITEAVVS